MSASLVTFANLGRKQNLMTPDIQPVIDVFVSHSELKQLICLLQKDFNFKPTISAIPAFIWYPLRVYEKLFSTSLSRQQLERLFDQFAQYRLGGANVVFFHTGYHLPRTLRKAHKTGSIAVDISTTAHVRTNAALEKEELQLLGAAGYEATFTRLAKESSHLGDFDYVIAISDFVKRSYMAQGYPEERIFTAELDIDISRFSPSTHSRSTDAPFQVLYAAYTKPPKGLHYLLDAWESLSLKDAELLIVGGFSDMPDELRERYLKRIRNNASIRWVGNTARPEEHYRTASVFAFPSLTEGFPKVVIEAMACGLPVITTENARGIVEDGKTGFVVPIRDAVALAEKIKYFYDHRDMAERMGKEARKAVENKKPFGEAVYGIYQEIMRRERDNRAQ